MIHRKHLLAVLVASALPLLVGCGPGNLTGAPTVAVEAPAVAAPIEPTTAPAGGARSNPAPIGSYVTVGDVTISILKVGPFMPSADPYALTSELEPGENIIQVQLEVTCNLSSDATCYLSATDFATVGDDGIKHATMLWETAPDSIDGTEFFGGSTITGNILLLETGSGTLALFNEWNTGEAAWFKLS